MRILIQAAAAAPGGSLSTLEYFLKAWSREDDLLVATWRESAIERFRQVGMEVARMGGRSTAEALWLGRFGLRRVIERFNPDMVWCQQYYWPGVGVPQVVHQRNWLSFERSEALSVDRLRDVVTARGMRKARGVVFNSQSLMRAGKARYPWLEDRDCHMVYNGVEPVEMSDGGPERSGRITVLVPQSDAPHKRSGWIPQILAHLRVLEPEVAERICFRVAGSGSYRELLVEAERLSVRSNIELVGYLGRGEMAREYGGADLVLITSRAESFCNPAVEAQSAGRRVVAPDLPVLRELGGPLVHLVSGADTRRMSAALVEVIRGGEPTRAARIAGRRFAAGFEPGRQAEKLREIFAAVV